MSAASAPGFPGPDIVGAILGGTQPAALTLDALVRRIDIPLDWDDQRDVLGFRG